MSKNMEDAIQAAVDSFENSTPNESRFDHKGVIKIDLMIDLKKICDDFQERLPFIIKSIVDFEREVISYANYFIMNELSILGCRVPDVVEFQLNTCHDSLSDIGYVVTSLEDFDVDSDLDLSILQQKFQENFVYAFFEEKSLYLLTQRLIEASALRKNAA